MREANFICSSNAAYLCYHTLASLSTYKHPLEFVKRLSPYALWPFSLCSFLIVLKSKCQLNELLGAVYTSLCVCVG